MSKRHSNYTQHAVATFVTTDRRIFSVRGTEETFNMSGRCVSAAMVRRGAYVFFRFRRDPSTNYWIETGARKIDDFLMGSAAHSAATADACKAVLS